MQQLSQSNEINVVTQNRIVLLEQERATWGWHKAYRNIHIVVYNLLHTIRADQKRKHEQYMSIYE